MTFLPKHTMIDFPSFRKGSANRLDSRYLFYLLTLSIYLQTDSFKDNKTKMVTQFEQLSSDVIMDLWEYIDLFSLWRGWFNLNYRFNQILCDSRLRFKLNAKLFPDDESHNFYKFCVSVMPLISSRLTSLTLAKHYTREFVCACGQIKLDRLKVLIFDETYAASNKRVS